MPRLSDRTALFALGLLGAISYYGLKAAARRTVVVLMPSSSSVVVGGRRYQAFVDGMVQACQDKDCMLHYICIPDLYHRYDAMLRALQAPELQGCPVICRIVDTRMLSVLERSGSKFVAVMSPRWVANSPAHIASIRPWDMQDLPEETAVITTHDEWIQGAYIADAPSLLDVATELSSKASNLIIAADPEELVTTNRSIGMLSHLYKSVRLLEGPTYSDGYEAILRALGS